MQPAAVLKHWYGQARTSLTAETVKATMSSWFGGAGEEFAKIQREAGEAGLMDSVAAGTASPEWRDLEDPHVLLAKIVIFDQYSRTAFKGTGRAFAFDALAGRLAEDAFSRGWCTAPNARFNHLERLTVGLCFQHSEDPAMQERGILFATEAYADPPPELASAFSGLVQYHDDHAAVVRRYGRFPHRNILLGRASTADELEWLASPDLPGWAKIAPKL